MIEQEGLIKIGSPILFREFHSLYYERVVSLLEEHHYYQWVYRFESGTILFIFYQKEMGEMNKIAYKSALFLKKNSSTILTCVGAVGVVATAVTSVKATPKALSMLEQAREEKGDDLTNFEVIKAAGVAYIPSVLIGVSTIACIFGANALNRRQQAALMSAYALLDQSYKEYRGKVKELYGNEADSRVMREITKDKYEEDGYSVDEGKELFFDFYSLQYFESTMEDVIRAEYNLNRKLTTYGFASLGEFYDELGLDATTHSRTIGWSSVANGVYYGYSWVDFDHEKVIMDDGLECNIISFPYEPTMCF